MAVRAISGAENNAEIDLHEACRPSTEVEFSVATSKVIVSDFLHERRSQPSLRGAAAASVQSSARFRRDEL